MNDLKSKATSFAKPYIDKSIKTGRTTQLPFKAHTSTNGKLGIALSLLLSSAALIGVTILFTHGVAKHASNRYRNATDGALDKLGHKAHEKTEEVKSVAADKAEETKGKIADAKDNAKQATAQAKETANKATS